MMLNVEEACRRQDSRLLGRSTASPKQFAKPFASERPQAAGSRFYVEETL